MSRQRADLALVERGLFESRAKAQQAIAAGNVSVDGKVLRKPSEPIGAEARIEAAPPYPWVSRGGVKLEAALNSFGFDPAGAICFDVGASTGGFTDVLLARGAAKVHAIDVGHGQLHPRLRADPRVILGERKDARDLTPADFAAPPAFITCDVSFISLRLVLPSILAVAAQQAQLISLIKPQFEAGPGRTVKGIVKDSAIRLEASEKIENLVKSLGWQILGIMPSPIDGGDGNQEFLLGARQG